MYRVLILLFLAIAGLTFAIDSSNTILQAKSIADTSVTLGWSPMEGAVSYKVSYDESSLLNNWAKPVYDSESVKTTEITIQGLTPATEYTFFVRAFAGEKEIGTSLPVHVKTFHSSSFALSGDPVVSDVETVQLTFTRPIDVKKTQVVLTNTKTKKTVGVDHIESSKDDMRVISLILSKKIEEGVQYDLMLKKVTTQAGTELPAENKTPLKIVYNSQNTPTVNNSIIDAPVVTQDVPQETTFDKPVPIDKLPQTGPREILFFFLIAAGAALLIQKKLRRGA